MNARIDFEALIDSKLNDEMFKLNYGNAVQDKIVKTFIKLANKYGMFGTKAMNFAVDAAMILAEEFKENKNED